MTTRYRNPTFFLFAMMITVIVCGCGERRKSSQQPTGAAASLHLIIRATVAGADLKYNSVYHDSKSRAFTVSDFRYYVSDIKAIRDDGTEYKTPCAVILVDPNKRDYDLGRVPEGNYKGLRFTIGLDSAINHCDPTVFEAGLPLAIQTPGMHWDWNSGYLFMKIEGRVDTTKKCAGLPSTEFFYHLGMDRMKRGIDIQQIFSISKSTNYSLRLKFDLAKVFACIDMRSEISTHSFDNQPLAARMADRWQEAFSPDW